MTDIELSHNEMYLALSPTMVQLFKPFFEIEMLQGEHWEADGMFHWRVVLTDEKAAAVKKWLLDTFPKFENQ